MTDLRSRFQSLDRARPPDLWPEIVARAAEARVDAPAMASDRSRSLAIAIGVFVLVVAVAVGVGLIARSNIGDPQTTPAASPSEASWTGPVRADAATLPVVAMVEMPELEVDGLADSRDSDLPWADIVELWYRPRGDGQFAQSGVNIVLAGRPPRAETLPADEVISYGFVIDTTADGVADYEVGIATDAHDGGDFDVWVTDLATGVTDLNAAPPYGYPVEFWHPSDPGPLPRDGESARTMLFTFLPGSDPEGFDSSSRIYAWSLVTRGDEVVAWDYAPDAAWARLPDQ